MKQNSDRRPNACAEAPASPTATGIPDGANLFLYVTSKDSAGCSQGGGQGGGGGELAMAVACSRNDQSTGGGDGRPVVGAVNVCPGVLGAATNARASPTAGQEGEGEGPYLRLVDTLLHETMHVLFFSPDLFPHYVNASTGQPLSSPRKKEGGGEGEEEGGGGGGEDRTVATTTPDRRPLVGLL